MAILEITTKIIRPFNIIELDGVVDGTTILEFWEFMKGKTKKKFFVDCTKLSYISGRGLNILLYLSERYQESFQEPLTLIGLSQCFQNLIYQVLYADKEFIFVPDLEVLKSKRMTQMRHTMEMTRVFKRMGKKDK